jgi:hypothetical protein
MIPLRFEESRRDLEQWTSFKDFLSFIQWKIMDWDWKCLFALSFWRKCMLRMQQIRIGEVDSNQDFGAIAVFI